MSAMIHFPTVQNVLDEEGGVKKEEERERWEQYCGRCFGQLEWWGEAAREQRKAVDPFVVSIPFRTTPSERDAPKKK